MADELRRIVSSAIQPPAGAYVHAIVHNGVVHCSGQVGVDPATGSVVSGVGAQTRQALSNLAAVLEAAGSSMDKVVKVGVYLRENGMFKEMDAAFSEAFGSARPARTTIPGAQFREGIDVEIDLIAAL